MCIYTDEVCKTAMVALRVAVGVVYGFFLWPWTVPYHVLLLLLLLLEGTFNDTNFLP